MTEIRWHFPQIIDGYMLQDPVQAEFFTAENVGGLSHAIVRESIQNALDARLYANKSPDLDQPVGVSFNIISVPRTKYQLYLQGLETHLRAVQPDQAHQLKADELNFLIIEDFQTRGLVGDYSIGNIDNEADQNNFFYFWRNVGRSGKSGDDRGRWGLGKSVFAVISEINTFFGITRREGDDKQLLLLGQSVLKHHKVGKNSHTPYGHFGVYENDRPDFVLPIIDPVWAEQFCDTFELLRSKIMKGTGNKLPTGLSIIIPAPDPEITRESLVSAVINQYFFPILTKKLYVRILRSTLKAEGLLDEINRLALEPAQKQRFEKLVDFTNWTLGLSPENYIQLNKPVDLKKAATWSNYNYLPEDQLAQVQEQFRETGRIAFKVPVKVQEAKKKPIITWFKVYLERDDTIQRAENYFIREGITITGIRSLSQRGLRGMVVVDEKPLTTMLGDAENPAHTEWHKDSLKFKGKYEHGVSTIGFVRDSLKHLANALTATPKELDRDLLRDLFSLPDSRLHRKQDTHDQRSQSNDKGDKSFPDIEGRKMPVAVHASGNGVLITSENMESHTANHVSVEFAYDVRTGDPFKKYVEADFDVNSEMIQVEYEGVSFTYGSENRLEFDIQEHPFRVQVTGFDKYRDLKVRLKWSETIE